MRFPIRRDRCDVSNCILFKQTNKIKLNNLEKETKEEEEGEEGENSLQCQFRTDDDYDNNS